MTTGQMPSSSGSGQSSTVRDELADDAGRLKDTATQRVKQEADTRKGEAARAAGSVSSALSKAAAELENDDNAPGWLTSAARRAAESIDRFASEVDGRSIDEIGRQVTTFARSNPGAFLAASAAAGFAGARVLRAGAEHRHHAEGNSFDQSERSPAQASFTSAAVTGSDSSYGGTDSYVRQTERVAP